MRLDRGLTQRRLAVACGVDPLTITRIEAGADAGDLPLRVVVKLASTLGTDVDALLDEGSKTSDDNDLVQTLGATLASLQRIWVADLVRQHALPPDVLDEALADLAGRLITVGCSLIRCDGWVWTVPRTLHKDRPVATRPLTVAEARLLRRIQRGVDVRRSLSRTAREMTLPALLRLGLVESTRQGPRMTSQAATALLHPDPSDSAGTG